MGSREGAFCPFGGESALPEGFGLQPVLFLGKVSWRYKRRKEESGLRLTMRLATSGVGGEACGRLAGSGCGVEALSMMLIPHADCTAAPAAPYYVYSALQCPTGAL